MKTDNGRAAIFVFSGTGNTLMCAKFLQERLAEGGVNASLHRIENGREDFSAIVDDADTVVVCYPVHAFNAPYNVVRFAKRLKNADKSLYFVKTSGEPLKLNDNSSRSLKRRLIKKGYLYRGEYHVVMPYNMIFRHSDEMAAKMWRTAQNKLSCAAAEIARKKAHKKKTPVSAFLISGVCKIERFGMRLSGKFYSVNKHKCIHCNDCIANCPVKNIRVKNGKFRFGTHCIGCMRCSFNCPQNAIRIGILNFMKVNGHYDFGADPDKAKIGKYCRRSYERYFNDENKR